MKPIRFDLSDESLLRALRSFGDLEARDLEAQGLPAPPAVRSLACSPAHSTSVKRSERQLFRSSWIDVIWMPRTTAHSAGWTDKEGYVLRQDDFPLSMNVQARQPKQPTGSLSEATSLHCLMFRLVFSRVENATPADGLDLYSNTFFDVAYTRPGGSEYRSRQRVTYDENGDLASDWMYLEPGHPLTAYRLQVRYSPIRVDAADAAGTKFLQADAVPVAAQLHSDTDIDMMWLDLGGEG